MRQPLPPRRGLQGQATSIRKRGGEGVTSLSLEQLVDEIVEQSPSE
jgi:hypothetical protein